MKTVISALIVALALSALAFSQNTAPRVRAVPLPPAPPGIPPQEEAVPAAPAENISIALTGTLAADLPIDVTLTGCGTEFRCDVMMGHKKIDENEVPIVGSLSFVVRRQGDDYLINYSIGARIPSASSFSGGLQGAPRMTNINYQEMMLSGEAKCVIGKEIGVFKSGAQVLMLKVTRPE